MVKTVNCAVNVLRGCFLQLRIFHKNCIEMAGREAVKRSLQQVRPILSVDHTEARRRVLNLYKAWFRQMPYVGKLNSF